MSDTISSGLSSFIHQSPTPAHGIEQSLEMIRSAGGHVLDRQTSWQLAPQALYAVPVSSRSLMVFRMPTQPIRSFLVAAAHSDSPCLRIKTRSHSWEDGCLVAGTEPYGGAINATWLDRTLRIGGTVAYQTGASEPIVHKNIEFSGLRALVPNLAIHLNRDINKGYEFNPQTQLRALIPVQVPSEFTDAPWEFLVCTELAAHGLNIGTSDILALDLYLADAQEPAQLGLNGVFSAPRIDNLAGCHAVLTALVSSSPCADALQVACLFDHEEVGSRSSGGADSVLLPRLLERVWLAASAGSPEERMIALEKSFMISVDVAHARHPNFPEKHDPDYAPRMGSGPVLKTNVNQRYATGANGAARFMALCRKNAVPLQQFTNRADMACGSTIGPALSSLTGIMAVDVGIPILSMHSIRETASLTDHDYMIQALRAFFEGV